MPSEGNPLDNRNAIPYRAQAKPELHFHFFPPHPHGGSPPCRPHRSRRTGNGWRWPCSRWPSSSSCSTPRSSTSRCRRSAATWTSPRTTSRGSSTPTRSSSAASCCWAGGMADLLGRRRLFMAGLILFAAGLAGRRARQIAGHADRRPRRAGPRRRAALAGRALARHRDVREGAERNKAHGRLGRRRRLRRRRRRAARRHAHRVRRLGVGPVRQRADRHRRRADRAAAAAREPQRRHAPLRRRRRGVRDRRPLPARLHAGRRQRRGLAVGPDARARRASRSRCSRPSW